MMRKRYKTLKEGLVRIAGQLKYVAVVLAAFGFLYLFVSGNFERFPLDKEAVYQIRNSDSVYVNRNYNYDGYKGGFTDGYGRWYEYECKMEVGGLFTEIDTLYTVKITPSHNAPEVNITSRKYQMLFYNYVIHVYEYYEKLKKR